MRFVDHRGDFELTKVPLDRRCVDVVARALQDFQQHDIADDDVEWIDNSSELGDRRNLHIA